MEKKQARNYIKEVLNKSFDQERFELFMRNLLNEYESKDKSYSGNLIPEAYRDHITYYKRIGKYTDPEGEQLDILIVQTQSVRKLERTRTALRNFVVNRLKKFDKQYGLAAFYSKDDDGAEWRFSFIKIEYESHKNEKGKIKVREELVPAKRFSFLVGKYEGAHTAQKQLLPLLVNDYSDPLIIKDKDGDGSIEGAFSIQKVTDAFYDQYQDLYLKLYNSEKLVNTLKKEGFDPVRFIKKLLGQIVFLYFLQKKGWLGVAKDDAMGEGSKRFLQDRFERAQANGEDYFNDFLRYLFYDALAREHNDEGITYFFKKLGCKVPFLNGGLFEADYDWENVKIPIGNELFGNTDKNKDGDKGTGILDVFDRYNFTIKEDEPLEKEVAVDPEMLGKVFENMLETTERKRKGAFYTPREIVHYMCQESLIQYLDNALNDYSQSYRPIGSSQGSMFGGSADKKGNLNIELEDKGDARVPKDDIETFIRKGHLALENEEIVEIAKQRIAKGEIKSTKHEQLLSESISKNAKQLDKALADIKICDPAIGSGAFPVGLLHEIVTARQVLNSFLQKEEHSSYTLKRHAIQNSIYGVDIDASAIDIARLRLWLSMIVDEDDYENIEALPNLDYKIINGNALKGLPKDYTPRWLESIEEKKEEFFDSTDLDKKAEIKEEIDNKIEGYLNNTKSTLGFKVDFDFKLFFSEVWHYNGGFDIVLGNPPYRQLQKMSKKEKKEFKKQDYDTYSSTGDIYELFYEKGSEILCNGGHLAFITSNKWLRTNYGQSTRNFFLRKTNPKILFDFGQELVFSSAIVHSNVMIFQKTPYSGSVVACQMKKEDYKGQSLHKYFREHSVELNNLSEGVWAISSPELMEYRSRLEKRGKKIKNWPIQINYGIKTGLNDAFIIDEKKKRELINEDKKNEEIIKPILRGRDTRKYYCNFKGQYLINSHNGVKSKDIQRINVRENYPSIFNYLKSYKPKIEERYDQGDHWSNLRNCAYLPEIEKSKIVYSEIVSSPQFYYDTKKYYPEATSFLITGKNLKWLIAFLNSSPITTLFRIFYAGGELVGKFRYKKSFLKELPIPEPQEPADKVIPVVVDYLTFYKDPENKTSNNKLIYSYFEDIIDAIVYEILFEDQLKPANKLVINHLLDLKPLKYEMSDERKLAIVNTEFERLYDTEHPVRNKLDTLDSVDVVKAIKEAKL